MKKATMFLSTLLSTALLLSPITAFADDEPEQTYNWNIDYSYTLECDAFKYSTSFYGIRLETELTDANFMISGICRNLDGTAEYYVVTNIFYDDGGCFHDGTYIMFANEDKFSVDAAQVQVGDLVKIAEDSWIVPLAPAQLSPTGTVEVLGHGEDILGEEFHKVIRHEILTDHCYSNREWDEDLYYFDTLPDSMPGDVTEDDEVGITDVIKTNRYVLGACQLGSYARLMADVDENGVVDSTDSLMILKEVVGLTENYVEVTE